VFSSSVINSEINCLEVAVGHAVKTVQSNATCSGRKHDLARRRRFEIQQEKETKKYLLGDICYLPASTETTLRKKK
jgi:hypothetical protein